MARLRIHMSVPGALWWALAVVLSPVLAHAGDDPLAGDVADQTSDASDDATPGTEVSRDTEGSGDTEAPDNAEDEKSDLLGPMPIHSAEPMPWSRGVPMEQRRKARDLFVKGNERARASLFATAESLYSDAIELWSHPAFYFNRATVQLHLGKNLDAYGSLKHALRYENAPLGDKNREEAERQMRSLESQLTRVVITCGVPGAKVTLNGSDLFTGPGRYEGVKQPGMYQIVAEKPGHLPDSREILFMAGGQRQVDLTLRYESQEHRWARWKPWAVVAGGAAMFGASGFAHWKASKEFNALGRQFAAESPMGDSAFTDASLEISDRAEQWRTRTLIGYLAGSAVLTTGVVLLYLNREQRVVRVVEGNALRVSVVPMLTPGSAGVLADWRF